MFDMFYLVYPISWALDAILLGTFAIIVVVKRFKKERAKLELENSAENAENLETKAV